MAKTLTPISVRNAKALSTRVELPDQGCKGLYLVIQPGSQAKSWAVRYRLGGRPCKLTLGPVLLGAEPEHPALDGPLSLAGARKLASEALHAVQLGRHPGHAKKARKAAAREAAADTFQAIAESYMAREGNKLRSADWITSTLRRLVLPTMGLRPIADIRRSDVVRLLDKVEEGSGPVQADRTLAVVRRIFNWHAARSDDFRSPLVKGMARTKSSVRARDRVLTDDELRAIWKAAEQTEGPFGSLVRFLLLTGARRSEAAGMTWSELVGNDWTLPSSRNKTKVDLCRPLSKAAVDILAAVNRFQDCDFVFTTNGRSAITGFWPFKQRLDEMSQTTGWTLHDLRRTARSLMSRAGVQSDHAERCLGHVIAGVRGVYDRHQYQAEMKQAYETLALQIQRVLDLQDNVTELRRA